jgi:MFS family permease
MNKSFPNGLQTADFTKDIGLQPEDLNTAVAMFFVFFVTLQPLGAALGRKIGMAIWVPGCMSIWGLCTIIHIWVRQKWQLILLRIVIGTLEGMSRLKRTMSNSADNLDQLAFTPQPCHICPSSIPDMSLREG